MANGTLNNLSASSYVRTDPLLATRIGQNLLRFPTEPFSVWDPSSGTGSLLFACANAPHARLFGTEISAERAQESRRDWPNATILTAAFEAVKMHGMVDLVLTNPPYFFQNGKRAALRFVTDAGEHLVPGGILVAVLTARADWDGYMINHWLKWYDHIRIWKFPDRESSEQEGVFEDYRQIVVIGVRRATPAEISSEEKKRLQGSQWKSGKDDQELGWRGETPPPDLPTTPIENPYIVPASRATPRLVVQNADEATLLYALKVSGAHLSPAWQAATTWPESGYLGSPAMPYTGEAHVAAEIMIGGLDGEIVYGPGTGVDAEPHLFTAFVGQEWVKRVVEDEVKQKLHEQGCIRVEMQELGDKPILGVLNLVRGTTHYYQGEKVFQFLQPWLGQLSSHVVEKRQPLYRLDPADWEIAVTSQFGLDKQLPKAAFPGLAVAQLHRVFAICRSLDVRGRSAIQGEPGTGKTRLATATAARLAYRWRHRRGEFAHMTTPAWVSGLRRAWLKNPRTRAMLDLEPVTGWHFNAERTPNPSHRTAEMLEKSPRPRVVAYRHRVTGQLVAPEDAGPTALPVLIATPLKVTKEYAKEIRAAYPQAEVMAIESHRDIARWLECCAQSSAPVVFGILSHSAKQQAYRTRWRPVVREKKRVKRVPDLDPDPQIKPDLEPVYDERTRERKGYRFKTTGQLLTKEVKTPYFYCPTCGGRIDATPGKEKEKQQAGAKNGAEKEQDSQTEPVTSITWFTLKPRWCKCAGSRRTRDRQDRGKQPILAPLWQRDRTEAANKKLPPCTFGQWTAAWTAVSAQAQTCSVNASRTELIEHVRRDERLLCHLVEVAGREQQMLAAVADVVDVLDPALSTRRRQAARMREQLVARIRQIACGDETWMGEHIERAAGDPALLARLLDVASSHVPAVHEQLDAMIQERASRQARLLTVMADMVQQDATLTTQVMQALLSDQEAVATLVEHVERVWPHLQERLSLLQSRCDRPALSRLLATAMQRCQEVCATALILVQRDPQSWRLLLEQGEHQQKDARQLSRELAQDQEALVGLLLEVARQDQAAGRALLAQAGVDVDALAERLADLACRDLASLFAIMAVTEEDRDALTQVVHALKVITSQITTHLTQAARRDASNLVLARLIEETRAEINWEAIFFHHLYEQSHIQSQCAQAKGKRPSSQPTRPAARTRLTVVEEGPITTLAPDRTVAHGYREVCDDRGEIVAYQMGTARLTPIKSTHSKRITGYVDAATNKVVMRRASYDFRTPAPDGFSPYDYLRRFFKGCVALVVVDESHNGRTKDSDIAQAFRQVMRASQMRLLTSGTHYGGDIISFYHYWFSYHPRFWQRLGFGWNDAEAALRHYGVIQQWVKEYESDARKGSGQTNTTVSTVPAPGLSAKLIPGLLEDLTYLTVLDVGAHMPPKLEIPKGVAMADPELKEKVQEAEGACAEAFKAVSEVQQAYREVQQQPESAERQGQLATLEGEKQQAEDALTQAQQHLVEVRAWAAERDLSGAYTAIVRALQEMAQRGNAAARLAQGTIPRWFAALPCDQAFEVYSTPRDDWGNKGQPKLVIRTPVLAWDHLYPMERQLIATVQAERAEHRTVMIYIEQITRSMSKRLEWVLSQAKIPCWILPHNTEAEDRQQVILDALNRDNHQVVIVPYRLVNEGLNLHHLPERRGIMSILWYEQSMNLFMYLQASQRAWRLGAREEVRIHLPFYIGTAAHTKMRKLGGQSGAAAAFAGEPAKGELIKRMGADQTTLARLSASLEEEAIFGEEDEGEVMAQGEDLAQIEAAFARRNQELADALKEGRQFLGVVDTLFERVKARMLVAHPDIWQTQPTVTFLQASRILSTQVTQEGEAATEERVVSALPVGEVLTPATIEPVAAKPAPQPVASTPTSAAKPSRKQATPTSPTLVFGDEEAIRLARMRRGSKPRRSLPRLKNPVNVKDIAAIESTLPEHTTPGSEIVVVSWWETTLETDVA